VKSPPFEYVRAESAEQAVQTLEDWEFEGKVLAGGQSLVPLLRMRMTDVGCLVDVTRVERLLGIDQDDDGAVRVGACVRQRDAERSALTRDQTPLLVEALGLVAHPEIRTRGTVGGSLAHADPAAELPAVAVALGAEMEILGSGGSRTEPAESFFLSMFTTTLEEDELLTAVRFPRARRGEGSAVLEVSRRPGDFAMAGMAVRLRQEDGECKEAHVVPFGVADGPRRLTAVEARLAGSRLDDGDLAEAAELAAAGVEPQDDVHATAGYRRRAVAVLCRRALHSAGVRAGHPDLEGTAT
jgi:carbon-monoxide dehydrogenase medium subunit